MAKTGDKKAKGPSPVKRLDDKGHVLKAYRIVPPKGSPRMRWYCEECAKWQPA